MKYVLLKSKERRDKKSCYKSREWYEVWSYTTNSLQKQNTNQVNNENYVTAEMETYLWRERCLSPRFRGEENKNLPKIRLPHSRRMV